MAWDDTKIEDGGTTVDGRLSATEWNAHVTDQKGRAKVSSGAGVPSTTPTMVGEIYHDTTNNVLYIATGTSSSDDWKSGVVLKTASFASEVSADSSIDWTEGNKQSITLTADTTLTFTDPVSPCDLLLKIVQDSTGGWTPTFPSNVKFENSVTVNFSSDPAGSVRVINLYYDGTNYYAQMTDYYS